MHPIKDSVSKERAMKKYNFRDNFEMVYLRHEYLRKIDNPSSINIEPYKALIDLTARSIYRKFKSQFEPIGFDEDDLISIASVYLTSYLGLYGFKAKPEYLHNYVAHYVEKHGVKPSKAEVKRIERNQIINFLRQKLRHCATVCARKTRNIVVGRDIKVAFAETANSKKVCEDLLLDDYKKHGHRKVTKTELKEIKENTNNSLDGTLYDRNGFRIIEVERSNTGITTSDYRDILDNYTGMFYSTPDELLDDKETDMELSKNKDIFDNMDKKKRKKMIAKFIRTNKGKKHLKTELKQARLLLKKFKA